MFINIGVICQSATESVNNNVSLFIYSFYSFLSKWNHVLLVFCPSESHICQLQYRMEKLKEANGDHENVTGEQINELLTKNNT